jgi:hypothetical protein
MTGSEHFSQFRPPPDFFQIPSGSPPHSRGWFCFRNSVRISAPPDSQNIFQIYQEFFSILKKLFPQKSSPTIPQSLAPLSEPSAYRTLFPIKRIPYTAFSSPPPNLHKPPPRTPATCFPKSSKGLPKVFQKVFPKQGSTAVFFSRLAFLYMAVKSVDR